MSHNVKSLIEILFVAIKKRIGGPDDQSSTQSGPLEDLKIQLLVLDIAEGEMKRATDAVKNSQSRLLEAKQLYGDSLRKTDAAIKQCSAFYQLDLKSEFEKNAPWISAEEHDENGILVMRRERLKPGSNNIGKVKFKCHWEFRTVEEFIMRKVSELKPDGVLITKLIEMFIDEQSVAPLGHRYVRTEVKQKIGHLKCNKRIKVDGRGDAAKALLL